jgi:hypothetical protein
MPEDLDTIAAAAAEDEKIARVRVATEALLHLQGQAVHAAAHVGHPRRQPHPHPRPAPGSCARQHGQHPSERRLVDTRIHEQVMPARRDDLDPARRGRRRSGMLLDHHRRHKPGGHRTDQCAGPVRFAPGEQQRARDPMAAAPSPRPGANRQSSPRRSAASPPPANDVAGRVRPPRAAEPAHYPSMPIHKDSAHRPAARSCTEGSAKSRGASGVMVCG